MIARRRTARRALSLIAAGAAWIAACTGGAGGGAAAPEGPPGVTHARIAGELDAGTLGVLKRAIQTARDRHHDRWIVEIDTPGGEVELARKLVKLLADAADEGVVPIAWVHDHAWSAGALIALACDRIYISPSGSIGSSMPVIQVGGGIAALPETDGVREKITSAIRSEFRAIAETHKRSPALAEAMVDANVGVLEIKSDGEKRLVTGREWDDARASGNPPELVRTVVERGHLLNLTGREAVEVGLADGQAEKLTDVLDLIGRNGAQVTTIGRAPSDEFIVWTDRLWMLILIVGIVLAYVEFKIPGFGVSGILSIACFAVVLAGRYLAGMADVPHIVAVAVGAALIALELFLFPGTLWLGFAGIALVVGGVILGSVGPGFDFGNALDRDLVVDASFRFIASAMIAALAAWILSRYLPKAPLFNRLVLATEQGSDFAGAMPEASGRHAEVARVGALGTAVGALRPVGKVVLDGDRALEHEALASGGLIERGTRVRVIEVSAARLVVESASEAADPGEVRAE